MATPVTIALRATGVSQTLSGLRDIRTAMLDIAKLDAKLGKLTVGSGSGAAPTKGDASARIEALKVEVKLTEELARARVAAGRSTGRGGGGAGAGGVPGAPRRPSRNAITDRFGDIVKAGSVLMALKGAVDFATSSLKQFGGFIIADVIRPALAMKTRSVQIANASGGNISADDVERRSRGIGIRNNMDQGAVMDAAGILQDATGDSKMSFEMMDTIATISKSRGADPKELAALAGAMHVQGMKAPELSNLLLTQLAQGDAGSVTLAQQAKLGGRMPAMAAGLAGDYATRMASVGSLLQTGKKGFGSVDEAATGLQQFLTESATHGKSFSARSMVRGADGTDKVANASTLLEDIYLKTHGNAAAIKAAGYSDVSARFAGAYKETYSSAFNESKSHGETDAQSQKDGALAVKLFAESLTTANTTIGAEEAKRNEVMATGGEVFESAMARFKEKLLGVMPAVDKLINVFSDTLTTSGDDIAGAVGVVVEAFILVAQGAQALAEWYKDKTTSYAEGDVKRVRRDVGDKTVLEDQAEKGYWKKTKQNFEYIVGSQDKDVDDTKNKGLFWKRVNNKTVWYNEEDANEFDANKRKGEKAAFDKDVDSRVKKGDYSLFGPRAEPEAAD